MTFLRDLRALWCPAVALVLATSACTSSNVSTSTGPSPLKCQVSVATSTPSIEANGGTGSVAVTTERECSWSVSSEASWIAIASSTSGQGDGNVDYRVSANLDTVTRKSAIAVNGQRAEILQAAAACQFTVAPLTHVIGAVGAPASVAVTAAGNCSWTAGTTTSWITITGGGSGAGNGIVNFAIAANSTGLPRAGTLTVAGQAVFVTQETPGCSYSINPTSQSVAAAGGGGTPIAVTTLTGCGWSATSNASWLTITSGAAGTGNGTVSFTIDANPTGTARTGTLSVAGRPFTVTQQGAACSYSINPTSQSVGAAGSGGTPINVSTITGCTWTAASNASWITGVTPGTGSGSGTVNFTIAANPTGTPRTGTLTVAGQTFSVDQQAAACSYSINPTSQSSVPAAGGAGTAIAVTTISGCAWTATSDASWLTITAGETGTGNGTANFTIAANPAGTPRTGTLTVAGRTFTVNQQAAACSYSINPTSQSIAPAGGAGAAIAVSATPGCAWTATSNASWITGVTPGSGSGNGSVNFTVGSNPAGTPRTGTLTVAGQTFTVNQEPWPCSYAINPTSQSAAAAGGPGTPIAVTATPACAWTAVSNASWITGVTPGGGTGDGTVNFTIGANPAGTPRTSTLTVAGQTFTVNQLGTACSYSINPTSQSAAAAGGAGTAITVTATAGCAWTATSNASWITGVTGGGGTGNGTVNFTIGANPAGTPRTGTLTVAGQTFTVNQQGAACSYSINPTSQSVAAAGGAGTAITVTATSGCAWTAVSNAPWLTAVTPASGSGNGTVNFTIAPNTGPLRTGTLTVAGQTFTVTQADGCSFTLNPPTGQTVPKTAGSYPVGITASAPSCGWTASVTTNFPGGGLSISGASSGIGDGTVTFAVTANPAAQRVGTLTIAGRTFTVTQSPGP